MSEVHKTRCVALSITSDVTAEIVSEGKTIGDMYFDGTNWIGNFPGHPAAVTDPDIDECFLELSYLIDNTPVDKPTLTLVK